MAAVTFQVLEGVDKGRVFRELATPVTIGREEGNVMRLNDERVSRFHAKVQEDKGDIIITDLESTNGTRVNGNVVQIRRLKPGDRICIGRSSILFGSNQEILDRIVTEGGSLPLKTEVGGAYGGGAATIPAHTLAAQFQDEVDFELNLKDELTMADGNLFLGKRPLPPLPQKLTPAQAARFAEILDVLHHSLTLATDNITANDDSSQVLLQFADWQKVLAVQMLLARYLRAVAEPDTLQT